MEGKSQILGTESGSIRQIQKNDNLSKYFLEFETIGLKLKSSILQLRAYCCIIGYKKGKWSNGPVSNFLIKDIP